MKQHENKKGFTLIELMVVLAIISTIAASILPRIIEPRYHLSLAESTRDNIREIQKAAARYRFDNGTWPTLNQLKTQGYVNPNMSFTTPFGTSITATSTVTPPTFRLSFTIPQAYNVHKYLESQLINSSVSCSGGNCTIQSWIVPTGMEAVFDEFVTKDPTLTASAGHDVKTDTLEMRCNSANLELNNGADVNVSSGNVNVSNGNVSVTNGNLTVTGRAGIGTTSPIRKLDVYSSGWKARFRGPEGYIDIGPANSSYAHIYTDRPQFYFNRDINTNDIYLRNIAQWVSRGVIRSAGIYGLSWWNKYVNKPICPPGSTPLIFTAPTAFATTNGDVISGLKTYAINRGWRWEVGLETVPKTSLFTSKVRILAFTMCS